MMSTTEELDVEVSNEREDGELEDSDVEEGTYIPLARPEAFNPPSLVHMQIQDEHSDEASAQESSCSDSDEELRRRAKRTKLKIKRPPPQQQPDKKEKYNVWCKALQEELLTEDMVGCDVSKKSRYYGVESYDYTIKYRLEDNYTKKIFNNEERTSNKRRHQDRSNVKLRLGQRVNSHHYAQVKQEPKYLENLTSSPEDSVEVVAVDIAEKLLEEKKDLVGKIVEVLGTNKAIEIYKEVQRVEADGGMLVMNGTRRRTPGGVYFFLLKQDDSISQEMVGQIFTEDKKEQQRKIKRTRKKVMEQLKQSLTGALSVDSELPSLSRGDSTAHSEHGSNPPPSPATDARDGSSDTDGHTDSHSHTDGQVTDGQITQGQITDGQITAGQIVDGHIIGHLEGQRPPRPEPPADDDDFLEVMCNDEMDLF